LKSGVYHITHGASGKHYVGSSGDVTRGWRNHRRALERGSHHSRLLQSAWTTYGAHAFEFAVLEAVECREDLIAREQLWMETLNAVASGFNVCPNAGGGAGYVPTDEQRANMSAAGKGRLKSLEHRAKIGEAHRGMTHTVEGRAKIGAASRARKRSPQSLAKLSATLTGKRHSDAARARISAALKGKPKSAEAIAKYVASRARNARPMSHESRARIAAASTGRKQSPETIAKRVAGQVATKARNKALRQAEQKAAYRASGETD
jgi:group I intron endonuclease